ncbi:PREDICTED: transmembrane emp24 domain-containing protein eca-like [Amphimedon queenslandica]|uniref:GOLD domain-containing protein n=1 Tax=Amphimedon queenslandica TaxID=400682 RepID=A0A1X7VJZ5_AMPQE|nr:PREDICTED: transmembrane emp24 domain-containing protein eca-like [Amphimedon queenslandica]|eukprot:XP_003383896.1 PREDICTED: transmembrane emp24 domain-containing protein eca-like [Amphimedon queenslandica]
MESLLCLVLLLWLGNVGESLYFHISETEHKCFIEEVPGETMIVGKYKIQLFDANRQEWLPTSPGIGMHVDVKNPGGKVVLSRLYSNEGRFTFTTTDSGEHTICISTNSTRWFGGQSLRVHLTINVGDHAVDYAQVAAKEKLTELQLRIRQLLDQVEQISKEQAYQRVREEHFREISDSTNARVLWWSFGQSIVLIVMGLWQMRHLKGFFEAKKLV